MATTVAQVISKVRALIKDSVITYRWSDIIMFTHIQTEQVSIIKAHPEAGYITTVSIPTVTLPALATESIYLIDEYVPQLVSAIVARIQEEDATQSLRLAQAQVHKKESKEA